MFLEKEGLSDKDKDKDKEFLFPMQQSGSLSPLLQRQDRGQ